MANGFGFIAARHFGRVFGLCFRVCLCQQRILLRFGHWTWVLWEAVVPLTSLQQQKTQSCVAEGDAGSLLAWWRYMAIQYMNLIPEQARTKVLQTSSVFLTVLLRSESFVSSRIPEGSWYLLHCRWKTLEAKWGWRKWAEHILYIYTTAAAARIWQTRVETWFARWIFESALTPSSSSLRHFQTQPDGKRAAQLSWWCVFHDFAMPLTAQALPMLPAHPSAVEHIYNGCSSQDLADSGWNLVH